MQFFLRRLSKLGRILRLRSFRSALRFGVAAAIEHETLIRALPISALIDVGANKGQFSLLVRAHHPHVPIHAFEPLDEAAGVFERLFAGDANVTLHRCAAGPAEGEAEINISGHADSSSLLPISDLQDRSFPGTATVASRKIRIRRIDDVLEGMTLPAPLLIKLDVQGFELEALKGMPRLLAAADYVYAELSFFPLYDGQPLAAEVIGWLSDQGLRLAFINDVSRTQRGVPAQADVLFARERAPAPGFPI